MAFWRGELLKVSAQVKALLSLDAIHAADEATSLVDADEMPLASSADGFIVKKITWANIKAALTGIYDWASTTHAASSKATPADADELSIVDSAASNTLKKLTWANLKAALNAVLNFYAPGGTDVAVADGGTGRSSHTAYAVLCGGTTTTGAQQSIASVGSSGQVLTSAGAGALPAFQSTRLQSFFQSSQQTITSAGALTLAHGLPSTPTLYQAFLQCTTAELGYSIGNEVAANPAQNGAGAVNQGLSMVPDATNINIRFGSGAPAFALPHKTTGAVTNITHANWRLVVRAWAA